MSFFPSTEYGIDTVGATFVRAKSVNGNVSVDPSLYVTTILLSTFVTDLILVSLSSTFSLRFDTKLASVFFAE